MQWHAIHVYFHDDNRDRLILDGVRPLFDRLTREASGASEMYFVPHWRRGPHVRLNFRTDEATFDRTVRPATEESIGAYLREHPSTTVLDPATILPMHERLAALEWDHGPLRPWPPNNTITVEEYDQRLNIHQNIDTAQMMARFYVATTPLTFEMLEGTPTANERRRLAFALLIATVEAFSPDGLARDYVTFRSHTEAFLDKSPGGPSHRADWDALYERNADHFAAELDATLATVRDTRDPDGREVPFLRRWVDTLRPIEEQVRQLQESGRLHMPTADVRRFESLSTEFHRTLAANPDAIARLHTDWFVVFRQLVNYTYLQLTRMGVTPAERHALCHLAANACDRRYGTTAVEIIAAGREAQASGSPA